MPSRVTPGNTSGIVTETDETRWDTDSFLSVTEASSLARVCDETIRSWYDCGEITGIRDDRGHRLIDRDSLSRRLNSVGVVEASRLVDRSPYMVRQWFDLGLVEGYVTATGRRRITRSSIAAHLSVLAERGAGKGNG